MQNKNALDETHWIWAKFDEHNRRHFGGKLARPQQILRSAFDTLAAAAVNTVVNGTPCRLIWLDGAVVDTDAATASDSLLHEMVHYELAGSAEGDGDQAHGVRFRRRADEVGRALGLLPCAMSGLTPEQIVAIARVWPKVQREAAGYSAQAL
jgi:hypothetical protein